MKVFGLGVGMVALIIALYAVFIAVLAAIVSWAWNLVVPTLVAGAPLLTFPMAFALIVLIVILKAVLFSGNTTK